MTGSGQLYVNGTNVMGYVANQWYRITLVLNWTGKTVDVYVDGVLRGSSIGFNAPTLTSLTSVLLYNYSSGGQGWWDEITFVP